MGYRTPAHFNLKYYFLFSFLMKYVFLIMRQRLHLLLLLFVFSCDDSESTKGSINVVFTNIPEAMESIQATISNNDQIFNFTLTQLNDTTVQIVDVEKGEYSVDIKGFVDNVLGWTSTSQVSVQADNVTPINVSFTRSNGNVNIIIDF